MSPPGPAPASAWAPLPAADRLIVALDVPDIDRAAALLRMLRPVVSWFKVGSQLFTAAGPAAVALVHEHEARVFLDLKFHDIPTTVAGAVESAAALGVAMMNVHIAGGEAMLRAAAASSAAGAGRWAPGWSRPIVLGVTVLTSDIAGSDARDRVLRAARLAHGCGLDGVVCSPWEAAPIKDACGRAFVVVTPGIRAQVPGLDDQRRVATPAEALRAGADLLVVGRPITRAPDPLVAAAAIREQLDAAFSISGLSATKAP